MPDSAITFEEIGSGTLRTTAPYSATFEHVRNILTTHGGTIKKDDLPSGVVEGAWRYGINPFGLRVTVQFRTVSGNELELHIKGGFSDAFDTTGAGSKKAKEILALIQGNATEAISTVMPPRLGADEIPNRGKTKTVAGVMAFLIGGVGAHKFYLGNWGLGIIYLISILIIPYLSAIIGVIEGIRLLTMSESDFNEKYNYANIKPFEVIW